jgi:predicted acetyltransferase
MALRLGEADWYSYLCDDGFVTYRWQDGDSLFVHQLVAASAGSVRALWSLVASHATMADTVSMHTGPCDPLWWLTRERDAGIARRAMWMLRVVDAQAAIAARGFPPASLEVPLAIEDRNLPANSGQWTFSIADGKGALTSGLTGTAQPLKLGPRGLAALYGGTPVASLRLAGLAAEGTADGDAALDAAFAANPYLLDGF